MEPNVDDNCHQETLVQWTSGSSNAFIAYTMNMSSMLKGIRGRLKSQTPTMCEGERFFLVLQENTAPWTDYFWVFGFHCMDRPKKGSYGACLDELSISAGSLFRFLPMFAEHPTHSWIKLTWTRTVVETRSSLMLDSIVLGFGTRQSKLEVTCGKGHILWGLSLWWWLIQRKIWLNNSQDFITYTLMNHS